MATRILIPSGVLGLGFDLEALKRGMARQPDILCIDGGSTDSGPYYLGTGTSKYSKAATQSEWRDLMIARAEANIPLVIGTCGTCGTDACVDWMAAITRDIAEELGQSLKIACLYSSQPVQRIQNALSHERLRALEPAPSISRDLLEACSNIVALAGAEQIGEALATGADIILAGRTTDTATIAALPLMRGDHAGAAWHGAKIGECGALCSTHPTSGVILVEFDETGFTVEPMAEDAACTPYTVSAHMLYENTDPFILYEPGGYLDVRDAHYEALDHRRVRVIGSKWQPTAPYTVKLEGARLAGYQTTILSILRDPRYVARAQEWSTQLKAFLISEIDKRMGLNEKRYSLEFRLIGVNAVLGSLESVTSKPTEVGVLGIITAETAEIAGEIGKLINPFVLHYPLSQNEELPTFAFPYSPAQSERGALYEFCLNHIMELDNPMEAFRLDVMEVTNK